MFQHEQLNCSKLDKSGRNKLPEIYNLLWQNQEEMKNLNRPIMSKEVIKKLPIQNTLGLEFTDKIYQRINFNLLMFLKNWKGANTSKPVLWARITLIQKPEKYTKGKENYTNIIDEYRFKNFKKNISKPKSRTHLKVYIKWL